MTSPTLTHALTDADMPALEQQIVDDFGQSIRDADSDRVALTLDLANAVRAVLWARKRRVDRIADAITAVQNYEGGHPFGYFLATLHDDQLAPDALGMKRAWEAVDLAVRSRTP